mmetsp:Transcript_16267/g.41581  ORF Transcript_16267/g.41581 Transcript_16267/m.41581 type:complete len:187 (-) Transcript_16267:127-687(-)
MDLHHKLRRDPNWHPNGCNICGQLGHQASTCPNGTVNWKEKYGESAFRLRINQDPKDFRDPTEAEWAGMMKDLKKKADEYVKLKEAAEKIDHAELEGKMAEMYKEQAEQAAAAAAAPAAAGPVAAAPAAAAEGAPDGAAAPGTAAEDALPPGWAAAKDTQGRTYYWFKKTQKVQWEKPTAESDTGE